MDPQRICRNICRQSKSNFVKTFYLLPRHRRHGFEAFYAFCRLVDDAVDEADNEQQARQSLQQWKEELSGIREEQVGHPVARALMPAIRRFHIPVELLEEIIRGCEMDLEQTSYQSFENLQAYCYRVASCVGLVSLHLFEADLTEQTRDAAIDLGMAVQLTNILRDLRADSERGRLYLPQEDLRLFNISRQDIESVFATAKATNPALLELIKFEMARARTYYQKAWLGFPADRRSRRSLMAATLMGKIYERLLDEIAQDPSRIFREKVSLSQWQKLHVLQTVFKETYFLS